ncbi:MAG: GTPase [Sulfolobales archaeon]
MEQECLSEKVKNIRIPSFGEVRKYVLNICSSSIGVPKGIKRKHVFTYIVKVDKIYNYVRRALISNLEVLSKTPLEGFYLEVVKVAGINDYSELVSRLSRRLRVIDKLFKHYRAKVKSSLDSEEVEKVFREYVGRVLSIIRRSDKELNRVREAIVVLSKTPCFEDVSTIVVAGMPQTGKSTFVGKVSSAKPKVSQFPFTTKDIILGHKVVDGVKIQIVDTPGILDRPLNELNPIERKAYIAVKYLADLILFLVDPLETYYSLRSQLKLLSNIINEFGSHKVMVLINKIDSADAERIKTIKEMILKEFNEVPTYCISALHGLGLEEVIKDAFKRVNNTRTHT